MFSLEQLAKIKRRKALSHMKTPDEIKDNLLNKDILKEQKIYYSVCYQSDGDGTSGRFPLLVEQIGDEKTYKEQY
ncbi:hypothetical protein [Reichenbachiella sp. MALMAid0571]|uniref:hypothetical protein n=1 Tax=Reichenbachiella sp. MALMAid0571 TaxID=3143939 RepID=UPI0032DF99E1